MQLRLWCPASRPKKGEAGRQPLRARQSQRVCPMCGVDNADRSPGPSQSSFEHEHGRNVSGSPRQSQCTAPIGNRRCPAFLDAGSGERLLGPNSTGSRKSWQMRLPWRQPGVGGQNWHHALPTVNVQQGWLNIYRGMRKTAHRKLQSRRAHPAQRSLPRMLQTEIQMHTDRCGALLYRAEYGRKGLRGLPGIT
ncbi:uncharacterized protein [Drosophila suzukii]|uniref:Uncharacterized protein isoform X1 n=1 Tax=Drosophila suzukii TaxID=28584 RepID=A0AB39ZZS6_DROSZ